MKPNFQLNAILINEIEGEKSIKKKRENNESIRVIRNPGHETGTIK